MTDDGLPTRKTQQPLDKIQSAVTPPNLRKTESSTRTQPPQVISLSSAHELPRVPHWPEDSAGLSSADEAVQKTHAIYQLAGRIAKIGFWEWDEVTDEGIYCSDELARIFGVSVDEFMRTSRSSDPNRQWVHPDDYSRYESTVRKFESEKSGYEIEYRALCANGRLANISEVAAPIFDSSGALVRSICFVRDITEYKQTAAALKKLTDMYARTEASANIGHWEWDEVADRATHCSVELARLIGVSVEEYLERMTSTAADVEWAHPDDRDRYATALRAYDNQPTATEIEYRMISDSGKVRHVREFLTPDFDQDGSLVRSTGYVQDISASKKTQEMLVRARDELEQRVIDRTAELRKINDDLLERERRLQEVSKIARLGWYIWDDDTNSGSYHDDEVAKILGVSPAECVRNSLEECLARVHPEDRGRVREAYDRHSDDGDSLDLEYRIVRPDGDIRHIRDFLSEMPDDDNPSSQSFGIFQDVTERKVLSEILAETEIRLHEFSSNSREVFCILSADWRSVLYVSPAYEEMWGRTCQSLLENPTELLESLHPDDRRTVISEWRDKYTNMDADPEFSECRIIRPDGSVRWLMARAYAIRDDNGKILRFAGIAEDVTERKTAADALHHAQKMDAIGQLTGGVAHDFNNLLAIMLGNAELLHARLSPEDKPFTQDIIDAGNRGAELTRRLLATSRQQPLDPVPTNLNALVDNMGGLLRRTLGTNIVVKITLSPKPVRVMVDPNQLENAVLNLALNARDAMHNGGILRIRVLEEHAPSSSVLDPHAGEPDRQTNIVVHDNGAGMDADVLSHALEPFFTTKTIGQGSGLGLPMVYGFAKQSKGDLVVESEHGKGTTVTLSLPCMREGEDRCL